VGKPVSVKAALDKATREMGKPVKAMGFEERVLGPHVVNIFFYSVEYDETGQVYRGKRGTWRILQILTARQTLHVYVTPSGMCRVFDKNGVEWKPVKR
jgi:hypothetical protein